MGKLLFCFLVLSLLETAHEAHPRFHVGQVVATTVTDTPQYFKIGFVAKRAHQDGSIFYWYTENTSDHQPYWSEDVLRPLTREECGKP